MFEAVIFDADRTIFNNDGIHELITKKIITELGMPPSFTGEVHELWDDFYFKEQRRVMSEVGFCIDRENVARSLVLTLERFGKELSFGEADKFWHYMKEGYSKLSKPYPEVPLVLEFLASRKIKLAIVSNGDYGIIMSRLENNGIKHFFEFVIAPCEEFPLTKPDRRIFKESLKMIKASAEKTIFVGDNPRSDIEGANSVGMFSVLIDRKGMMTDLRGLQIPNLKISSLEEIKELFE